MPAITSVSTVLRRAVAAVGVASLALLAGTQDASADTDLVTKKYTFNTYKNWDGVSYLQGFGSPQTSNYGQVITVPAANNVIKNFTYYMAAASGTGTLTYRAYVYGWDGKKATDEVYRSKKKTFDTVEGDTGVRAVTIKTAAATVAAGEQYVLFLSIDEQFEDNPFGVTTQWALDTGNVLPDGSAVWLNSDGDESQWTTVPWAGADVYDMAFKASLGSA